MSDWSANDTKGFFDKRLSRNVGGSRGTLTGKNNERPTRNDMDRYSQPDMVGEE